jgi:hypothetical protein
MNKYSYTGPVEMFDKCVCNRWKAETTAVSAAKAKANFKYRYKIENGLTAGAKINLPGKIELVS